MAAALRLFPLTISPLPWPLHPRPFLLCLDPHVCRRLEGFASFPLLYVRPLARFFFLFWGRIEDHPAFSLLSFLGDDGFLSSPSPLQNFPNPASCNCPPSYLFFPAMFRPCCPGCLLPCLPPPCCCCGLAPFVDCWMHALQSPHCPLFFLPPFCFFAPANPVGDCPPRPCGAQYSFALHHNSVFIFYLSPNPPIPACTLTLQLPSGQDVRALYKVEGKFRECVLAQFVVSKGRPLPSFFWFPDLGNFPVPPKWVSFSFFPGQIFPQGSGRRPASSRQFGHPLPVSPPVAPARRLSPLLSPLQQTFNNLLASYKTFWFCFRSSRHYLRHVLPHAWRLLSDTLVSIASFPLFSPS